MYAWEIEDINEIINRPLVISTNISEDEKNITGIIISEETEANETAKKY